MFFDLALVYDPDARACDLEIGEDGDLLIDETSITPQLLSIGLDRRAENDDELPEGRSQWLAPASFSERRGGPADALDPFGERIGSRLWLLDRAKQTETTRQLVAHWLAEALAWALTETGQAAEIEVAWRGRGLLVWRTFVADTAITLSRRVEA
jgi:phage gp46-like protein